jgi:putative hemolysin
MSFIEKSEIKTSLKSTFLSNDISIKIMSGLLGWNKANQFYDRVKSYNTKQFLNAYKRKARIKHIVSLNQQNRIPRTGSLLIIANHPTGIPDGLLILDQVLKIRPDVKVVANQLTYKVDPLKLHTIPVDPYDQSNSKMQNGRQIKSIFDWLNDGHCIILFPAGDVADYNFKEKQLDEQFWHPTAKKIILKHTGHVLPWAINGKNSSLFYQLGKIHPSIKSALMTREGLKSRRKPIFSQIGFPIKINGSESLLNDLETKIKLMCLAMQQSKGSVKKSLTTEIWSEINAEKPTDLIQLEINNLNSTIIEKGALQVFLTTKNESPNIIEEIGRLREITFRNVNEGTGNSIDIDHHDSFFEHLILWDKDIQKIAGAYRLGNGQKLKVIENYTSIIFDFYKKNANAQQIIDESLILGRAFIAESHQQKPFPLFLLWQGIFRYIGENPQLKYIIGQTSLPNSYQPFSKKIIVDFLLKKHSCFEMSPYFKAYHNLDQFENPVIDSFISDLNPDDFKRIDDMVQNIEPNGDKIPMLFKRYVEQNAKCIGMNIDPAFQNSIDILMLTKI